MSGYDGPLLTPRGVKLTYNDFVLTELSARAGDVLTTALLLGLELPVTEIFRT